MAPSEFSKPGTEFGPCEEKTCGHTDCAEIWQMVEKLCPLCSDAIGFERPFIHFKPNGLVHYSCALEQVE